MSDNRSMSLSTSFQERSNNQCELCTSDQDLSPYLVEPKLGQSDDDYVVTCARCHEEMNADQVNEDHWRCLNESIWSPVPAVQVISYRLLQRIGAPWTQDLLNMMYMDESTTEWAQATSEHVVHKDSNGHILQNGDTVILIQDLNVKGASFTAKRGTAVRKIILVAENEEHIQGKINGQTIIILTKYVKRSQ